jgi:Spy/CpxP family protein refolding chaperone
MRNRGATLCAMAWAGIVGLPLAAALTAGAAEVTEPAEQKSLRPEVQQLVQSVSEKVQAAADKLDLTDEQRSKIREIGQKQAEQRTALRTERRNLLQEELRALGAILTPEQRDKIKEFAEDKVEQAQQAESSLLPKFSGSAARDTLAERTDAAAEKLGLTKEQRDQIIETLKTHAVRHAALRAKCRQACENEFEAVAAVLTPEQRAKARQGIEERIVIAAAAKSVADRLDAIGDKLGLSKEQREQIAKTQVQFAGKYQALRSERRELLQEELKAIGAILTPEQREKVKDFFEDRVVMIEVTATGATADEAMKALRETVSERLESVGDRVGLTAEQRNDIREVRSSFADKFKSQREQRKALRQEEIQALGAVLSPEQREKVREFVEDYSLAP